MNQEKKPSRGGLLRWCWAHSGPGRRGVLLLAFFALLQAVIGLVLPLVFRLVVDAAAAGSRTVFLASILGYAALFLLLTGLDALIFHFNQRAVFRMETDLRAHLYQGLLRTEYAVLNQRSLGELQNHLNDDVSIVVDGLTALPAALLFLVVRVAGASLILLVWDWRFFLLFLLLVLALCLGAVLVRRPMQSLQKQVRQEDDEVQTVQQDTLRNALTVQAFFAYPSALAAWRTRVGGLRRAIFRQNAFSNLLHTGYSLITDLGYLGCLLWYGMGVAGGAVTYGTLAGALQLVGQIQSPFSNLTQIFSRYTAMRASAQRLADLDALDKDPVDGVPDLGRLPWLDRIRLDRLSFSYGDMPVLEDVSLTIHRGDCIAFVGVSGAGKSTLLRVLLSLYHPTGGSVTLYDEQGRAIPLSPALRRMFAYVPQGNGMMAGTIYQAVSFRYDRTEFTPEEKARVRRACAAACADEFIRELPNQYDTRIREAGAGLSEGQLQRLSIARALFYQAPVLLLDEATSALDEQTERQVLANLRDLHDRTVLIVTHNPQALEICNRVVRVENTRLYEQTGGSPRREDGPL